MEADNSESGGLSVPGMASESLDTANAPVRKRSSPIRKIVCGCVFWIGMALIGVLAVPTEILFGVMEGIVRGIGFLTDRISKG